MRPRAWLISAAVILALLGSFVVFVRQSVKNEVRDSLGLLLDRTFGPGLWEAGAFSYGMVNRTATFESFSFKTAPKPQGGPKEASPNPPRDGENPLVTAGSADSISFRKPLLPKALTRFSKADPRALGEDTLLTEGLELKGLRLEISQGGRKYLLASQELVISGILFLKGGAGITLEGMSSEPLSVRPVAQSPPKDTPYPESQATGLLFLNVKSLSLERASFPGHNENGVHGALDPNGALKGLRVGSAKANGLNLRLSHLGVEMGNAIHSGLLLPVATGTNAPIASTSYFGSLRLSLGSSENTDPSSSPFTLILGDLRLAGCDLGELTAFLGSLGMVLANPEPLTGIPLSLLLAPEFGFDSASFSALSFESGGFELAAIAKGGLKGPFAKGRMPDSLEGSLTGLRLPSIPKGSMFPDTFDIQLSAERDPSGGTLKIPNLRLGSDNFGELTLTTELGGLNEAFLDGTKTLPLFSPRTLLTLPAFRDLTLHNLFLEYIDQGGFMMGMASIASRRGQGTDVFSDSLAQSLRYLAITRLDPLLGNAEEISEGLTAFLANPKSLALRLEPIQPVGILLFHDEAVAPFLSGDGPPDAAKLDELLRPLGISIAVNGAGQVPLRFREVPQAFFEGIDPAESRNDGLGDIGLE
ncbi:MAG: hypothetical protein LBF40_07810 [Deltaproteobacteria bacterium]|jgi:hypothetical protein|nr:hypothetical protein [Deltaproteobacteria bacterium]